MSLLRIGQRIFNLNNITCIHVGTDSYEVHFHGDVLMVSKKLNMKEYRDLKHYIDTNYVQEIMTEEEELNMWDTRINKPLVVPYIPNYKP